MPRVEFFFDYLSPWSYLAFVRLREAAVRTSSQIIWKPLDVHRVFATVNPGAGSNKPQVPARDRYLEQDLADWAEFCGVVIRRPSRWPDSAEQALRVAAALSEARQVAAYSKLVFEAFFAMDQDISDPAVIRRIVASLHLDPESIGEDLRSPRTLEANAVELIRRGGFGVPTMFVGDKMFFGNDRMPLVELALTRAAERPFVAPGAHGQLS